MIKFFKNIRKNLLKEGKTTNTALPKAFATAKALSDTQSADTYLKYDIGELVLAVIYKTALCPVRDTISVAGINTKSNSRAFRYGILYNVPKGTKTFNI